MTLQERLFLAAAQQLGLLRLNHAFFYGQQSATRPAKPMPAPVPGGLLDARQLAQRLGCSVKFIYERTTKHCPAPMPHYKVGKFVRFKPEQVEQWLATQER